MADSLYELLVPHLELPGSRPPPPPPSPNDPVTIGYLNRLSTLPLSSLNSTEPQALSQSAQSLLVSLRALSSRSRKAVIESSDHLSTLRTSLPAIARSASDLRDAIPKLDEEAVRFSETYNKNAENAVLDRRRKALLLSRNVDRIADILDLPTLLSSAVSSSGQQLGTGSGASSSSSTSVSLNYASALDLNAHIRRLHLLYPDSSLISSISQESELAMQSMTTNLIASLRVQGVKLAAAMRTISWLRRVAPELEIASSVGGGNSSNSSSNTNNNNNKESSFGALFLVCRLANLVTTLEALAPLRDLADNETLRRRQQQQQQQQKRTKMAVLNKETNGSSWSGGQQTEKYLKRYVEIFREQSFAIISMYRSIFPPAAAAAAAVAAEDDARSSAAAVDPLEPLPSALSTFPLHLVELLTETLRRYLPNVRDRTSRDSLLTQVLYCAGSLGRLGGDFSMVLAMLEEHDDGAAEGGYGDGDEDGEGDGDSESEEWVEVVKKHRVLAGRLEMMVGAREG